MHKSKLEPYRPPVWLRNGHVQSVWPTLFRKVSLPEPVTEVLATADEDELHLDWYRQGSSRLAVLSHGLEGHSRRPYVLGLARALMGDGWDVLAWNFRSCGGQMNHRPRFYHSGATEDLHAVVSRALSEHYRSLFLSGFSMGGNLTLLYLAEQGAQIDCRVSGAVTYSVPLDLAGSADVLALPSRRIYMQRFLNDLHAKMLEKSRAFPEVIDVSGFEQIRDFHEFDNRYTAPLHGFRNAADYWARCSALFRLSEIRVPALVVNAADDPFLSPRCFPCDPQILGPCVQMEVPRWGGHVGFVQHARDGYYWSERRALGFVRQVL
ncbi:alpha/beta fold hydrolase [Marinobacter daepoensis]|uniref:YheT family hydrolase n=1 Tax=Marinobacter daepoensis TaxID=262077 RepID=UPI001C93F51E|nr:alpha/beta fold hydrolase [Marinobacter daepoensis]MBY6032022.1 alpha/beta fold hydrolase [Marinobacter daepoensis]